MALHTPKTTHAFDISCCTARDIRALKANSFMKALTAKGILLSPKDDGGLKLHTKSEVAADLLQAIAAQKATLHAYLTQPTALDNPQGPYPLSEQQERLWLAYQADPTSSAYNEPLILSFSQPIDIDAIRHSIHSVQHQFPILRVRFASIDGIPCQWVSAPNALSDFYVEHTAATAGTPLTETEYQAQVKTIALTPFDLSTDILFRVGLYQLADGSHKLVLVLPHILTDGWATMNLVDALSTHYAEYPHVSSTNTLDTSADVPFDNIQTHDIVFDTHRDMHQKAAARLDFWTQHFDTSAIDFETSTTDSSVVEPGILPALYTPTDNDSHADTAHDNNLLRLSICAHKAKQLTHISRQLHVSEASVCLALYAVAFSKIAMLDEFIVSTPFANRSEHNAQDFMGLMVNTLPIRVQVNHQQTLAAHIQHTHQTMLEYIELQDTPLELVLNQCSLTHPLSSEHLFQSVFEYQTFDSHVRFGEQLATFDDTPFQAHKFPLTFLLRKGEHLVLEIEFDTHLYHRQQIDILADAFLCVVDALINNLETSISAISLLGSNTDASLSNKAQHYLANTFNYAHTQWNEHYALAFKHVNELIYQRVKQHPEKTAVKTTQRSLSYADVWHHSLALAELIHEHTASAELGIELGTEVVIGVFMPSSCELIISLLGTLLSGQTYLPLDPALPDQRLQRIIHKSQCQLLLHPPHLASRAQAIVNAAPENQADNTQNSLSIPTLINIEQHINIHSSRDSTASVRNLPHYAQVKPKQLAYVIFTSGSSGEPKGAMIEHEGMLNHLLAKADDLGIQSHSNVGFIATPSFDVSIWQMLSALCVGGTTTIFEGEAAWDPERLFQQIKQQQVNVIESVPSHLNALLDYLHSIDATSISGLLPDDFLLMLNGEPLLREQCLRWKRYFPHSQLVNAYGLTEVSDDTCHFHIASNAIAQKYQCMPISGTLPNMRLYILDQDLCPVPAGVKGELYIGGIAVGRGYLADQRRTAERFIPDPFATQAGARLYRSGDIVWADHEGAIHFLGRNDFQIKVRGFRIEVQEIENAIHQMTHIDNVAVMVDGDGDQKQILAFYQYTNTANDTQRVSPEQVRTHLLANLPEYMVPDVIIGHEQFPLTTNGKIDRKRLLANSRTQQHDADAHHLASHSDTELTSTEQTLRKIFLSTLNIQHVGLQQSFFTVGGNSLIALRIVNQIRQAFDIPIKVSDILKNETISKLAALIDAQRQQQHQTHHHDVISALNAIERQPTDHIGQLTPYQLPEWYMYRIEPDNPYYNISFPNIFFEGALDTDAFFNALRYVISRHRALRSRFSTHHGQPVVTYDDNISINANECLITHTGLTPNAIEAQIIEYADTYNHLTLDLSQCCFETKLIKYADDYYQFIWVVHHIIWDETSTLIFFDELSSAYNALLAQQSPNLTALPFEYADFERTINGLLQTPAMQSQKAYWDAHLHHAPTLVNLPTDRPRQASQTFNGDGVLFHFTPQEKQQIEQYLAHNNTTLFIYLLSILNLTLFKITGETDQVIGAPIANRDSDGLHTLIGLFATALPLRSQLNPQQSFASFLAQSKTVATDGFDNHNYPSIYALRDSTQHVNSANVNRFNIMYGVQNDKRQWKQRIDFQGVNYIERDDIGITEGNTARFDLTVVVDHVDDAIEVYFNFNTDLFDKQRIEFYLDGFRKLVLDTLADDSKALHQYTLIADTHTDWREAYAIGKPMQHLICATQATSITTLPEWVLSNCAHYAKHIAVDDQGDTYTYAQLKQGIAQYIAALNAYPIAPETPIVVYSGHSIHALCAMIAVMYQGATYIPLFASTPAERALEVIAQTQPSVIFMSESLCHVDTIKAYVQHSTIQTQNTNQSITLLPLESTLRHTPAAAQAFDNPQRVLGSQLAYNMFTSGTTGKPKGIAVTHSAIMNTIASTIDQHRFTAADNLLLMTESHFDPYFLDVFCAFATGARLIIIPECERKTPSRVLSNLAIQEVSFFQGTPTFLDALCREVAHKAATNPQTYTQSVRLIITGGEQITPATADAIQSAFPNAYLANHYGPSEVAVDAIACTLPRPFDATKQVSIPIGTPIANVLAVVLDDSLEPVPLDHIGELYILSPGLARGYVNHPAMSAERFLPSTFARYPGERMYRTGDKVRMDKQGQIHFIGREDEQLKINGSRVELTEIEAVIANQPGIDVAAVIYQQQQQSGYLAAYLKMSNPRHIVDAESRTYTLYPLAHKPHMLAELTQLHAQSWPAFFAADRATQRYWSALMRDQAGEQLLLLNQQQQLAGAIHSTCIHWDGRIESLAGGWSSALQQGIEQGTEQAPANTLVALAALVSPHERGQKLSARLLDNIKQHARAQGMTRCIIPLRVTGKSRFPDMSFDTYAHATTDNGDALDPWLNIHLNAGARVLGIAQQSQHVVASTQQWETWLDMRLPKARHYTHPELHTYLSVNDQGEGVYHEPCIWVEHPLDTDAAAPNAFLNIEQLREQVRRTLPSFMVPSAWHAFTDLPTNINGKIDKNALHALEAKQSLTEIKPPQSELACRIHGIWQRVLEREDFGVQCHFFMIGGHSLSAMQCLEEINEHFNANIPLKAFLRQPTIESLCAALSSNEQPTNTAAMWEEKA